MEKKTFTPFSLTSRGRLVQFDKPAVMGILNITPDSFYDGGRYTDDAAMLAQAEKIISEGADIVDIGASSSRPGAILIEPDVEASRLEHAVALIRSHWPDVLISVDTCYSMPARCAIAAGADIINDIGGGDFDSDMFAAVADMQVSYILMHNRALPHEMQQHTGYDDIVDDLTHYFSARLDRLYTLGVKDVWLDPGFGFAKSLDDNYDLLHRLDELTTLFHQPMLAALSRKSMIYRKLGTTPNDALSGTIALDTVCLLKGCRAVRVHDVLPAVETIKLLYT